MPRPSEEQLAEMRYTDLMDIVKMIAAADVGFLEAIVTDAKNSIPGERKAFLDEAMDTRGDLYWQFAKRIYKAGDKYYG